MEVSRVEENQPAATRSAKEPPIKRQATAGRVFALDAEVGKPPESSRGPITGTLHVGGNPTHVLFDSGASHSFVTPEVVMRFREIYPVEEVSVSVVTPGNQILRSSSLVVGVPLEIVERIFRVNLFVVPMIGYEVILGMDWLSRNRANLDCSRGRVTLRGDLDSVVVYQGIRPSTGVSVVSALRVQQQLVEGCVYLVAINVVEAEVEKETKVEEIPVVSEFVDVFKSLTELPPPRSNPFTINLIPGRLQ
ncbi:unnamed protein product [Microthlaspi erraticum]|uniref:RVP_2 domain-containing protein n=1 Tax=Microthlaspi erraticum TaxID=1685480 RepID=A0A6D2JRT5_9BRAS|nr:unnamed protein product [Microthlaspi erraticum]